MGRVGEANGDTIPWYRRMARTFTAIMLAEGVDRILPASPWWVQLLVFFVVVAVAEIGWLGRLDIR